MSPRSIATRGAYTKEPGDLRRARYARITRGRASIRTYSSRRDGWIFEFLFLLFIRPFGGIARRCLLLESHRGYRETIMLSSGVENCAGSAEYNFALISNLDGEPRIVREAVKTTAE